MEQLFAKGKRSNVFLATFKNKKAVAKKLKPGTEAIGAIRDEILWLKKLNQYKIGPKIYFSDESQIIMEYIEGERIIDYLMHANKTDSVKALLEIFRQCRVLDKLKISKEEMQNPYKHILVGKKIAMIDFEKCHYTERPQNVTQFCQFLMSSRISKLISGKGIKADRANAIELLKVYKRDYSDKIYRKLLNALLKH